MTRRSGNIDDFGMAAATLAGPLEERLAAIRDAGFTQVMLDAADVAQHPGGVAAAARAVEASGLRVTGLRFLRDFEGFSGRQHAFKLAVATQLLQMAHALGAPMLLVASSSHPEAVQDMAVIARDLRKLAMLAIPLGLKVAYEGTAAGRTVRDCYAAWDAVVRADMPNLGLAIDAADTVQGARPLDDLETIDAEKIFVVCLADAFDDQAQAADPAGAAARQQVFAGEGRCSGQIAALVVRLAELGYCGDYCCDAGNDDYRQLPQAVVSQRASAAALWLGEDVLRRSVPLPGQLRLSPERSG